MTDPAKELAAELPGPMPWSVDDNGHEEWIADAGGKPIDFGKIVAWANEAGAQLAAKELAARLPGPHLPSPNMMTPEQAQDILDCINAVKTLKAQLAVKNVEIERLEAESRKHFADGLAFLKRLNTAEGQLAAATRRIASAERVISELSDIGENCDTYNDQDAATRYERALLAARSWLTQGKDGETDAEVDEKHERTLYAAPGGGWFSTRWEFEEAWREHKERGSSLTATAEPGGGATLEEAIAEANVPGLRHYATTPPQPQPQPADRKGLASAAEALWNEFCLGIRQTEEDKAFYLKAAEIVATALSQAPSGCEGWRDIKTAPKDWSNVLLYDPEEEQPVFEGFFSCKDGGRNRWIKGNILSVKPTHWQPLPAPPRSRTDSTEGATKA